MNLLTFWVGGTIEMIDTVDYADPNGEWLKAWACWLSYTYLYIRGRQHDALITYMLIFPSL